MAYKITVPHKYEKDDVASIIEATHFRSLAHIADEIGISYSALRNYFNGYPTSKNNIKTIERVIDKHYTKAEKTK